jgi:hypothetical protein
VKNAAFNAKHCERAVDAIAGHRCSTDLTDGFCGPWDGRCRYDGRPTHRNCIIEARGILEALASRGMMVVWIHDKELPAALEGLRELADT